MPLTRCAKAVMTWSLAAFALLAAISNLTDYGANFAFVQHVLRMDTTFPGSPRWRAIEQPWVWHTAYALIIGCELLVGTLLAAGGVQMWRQRQASAGAFHRGKRLAMAGFMAAFLLWFVGFVVVGGEWFLMWQSTDWNGQDAASRFVLITLGVAIFVNQRDELPAD